MAEEFYGHGKSGDMEKYRTPMQPAFEFRNCSCGKIEGHWLECPAHRDSEKNN